MKGGKRMIEVKMTNPLTQTWTDTLEIDIVTQFETENGTTEDKVEKMEIKGKVIRKRKSYANPAELAPEDELQYTLITDPTLDIKMGTSIKYNDYDFVSGEPVKYTFHQEITLNKRK